MLQQTKKPEIIVFAGPNGSGKSTVTKLAKIIEPYINADEIKRTNYCIYDNSILPFRIFKKRKDEYFFWANDEWSEEKIHSLTGIKE